jgi:dTDP-4-dehydrorhamnose reductase
MKILVAGASGQVATCLAMLGGSEADHQLTCLGRPALDITQEHQVFEIMSRHRPQIIVNASAYTDVERAEDEPEAAMAVNAHGVSHLAKAADRLKIPLIHISTDYVFSGDKETPYIETDQVGPINAYGRSKLAGELAIQSTLENYIILRSSWVYSPFGKNFMKTMMSLFQTRDQLNVVADQIGNPTSAWDIARTILDLCSARANGNQSSGLYHLAGSGTTSWHGFATAISELSKLAGGRDVAINPIASSAYPTKARRPRNSALDTRKIESDFGIHLPLWQDSLLLCHTQLVEMGRTSLHA